MQNLTLNMLDAKHVEFIFKKYIEEYGIEDSIKLVGELSGLVETQADQWGINFGSEVQNAN
jgi:hypothetical protein